MKTEIKTRKTVPLCGGAEAHVNLLTGENAITFTDITDGDMGVTISHVLQQNGNGENSFCCGKNMRLNLHETFVKNEDTAVDADYIYTDSMGDTYAFKEYFNYVTSGGAKKRITDKTKVTVYEDGNLSYTTGGVTYPVEREVVTYDGMRASTKLEGVKNIENYEQRIDELKQVEEQYDSYKNAFLDYVICDASGNVVREIEEPTYANIKSFASTIKASGFANLVLTKSEALNLKLLCMSESNLNTQTSVEYLTKLTKTNARHLDELLLKFRVTYTENTSNVLTSNMLQIISDYPVFNINTKEFTQLNVIQTEEWPGLRWGFFDTVYNEYVVPDPTEFVLHRNEGMNLLSCYDQQDQIDKQKEQLGENSARYIESLLEYYDKCVECEKAIKNLKLQAPVSFIMTEDGTKGFNESGELVVMYNKRGNYVAVDYENYYDGTKTLRRIRRVYDDKEREISFAYNHKNMLSEITDSKGKTTKYEYTGNIYFKVLFSNGRKLTFYFNDGNVQVTDDYRSRYIMELDDNGKLSRIVQQSSVVRVSHGEVELGADGYVALFTLGFSCGTTATITDNENNTISTYLFDTETERLINFFEEKNGVVARAEAYSFSDLGTKIYTTTKAKKDSLYLTPYSSFTFEGEDSSQKTISVFNYLVSESNTVCEGDVTKTQLTEYTYTPEDQVCKAVTTVIIENLGSVQETQTHVVLYEYNGVGALLKKQSYTEGEEHVNGIDIEEHVYDKNGCEIKTVTYNSLDPSSKFYTEKEYDENGKEIGQLDPTGKHKTTFLYDGEGVSSQVYPNGAKLSYGSCDIDGNSAITMSTEEDEENSIQVFRTNGLVTKVKNAEIEYNYEYDNKGRETLVTVKGLTFVQRSYVDSDNYKRSTVTEKEATISIEEDKALRTVTTSTDTGTDYKEIEKQYDSRDNVSTITEYSNYTVSAQTDYTYDSLDRLTACTRTCNDQTSSENTTYDVYGNVSSKVMVDANGTITYNYTYSDDSKRSLTQVEMVEKNLTIVPKTDCLGRSTGKEITANDVKIDESTISYIKHGSHATNMPATITYADGSKISYKYDSMGNIIKVYENGLLVTEYEYDALGRLVRENNSKMGVTYVIKYDNKGNILAMGSCQCTRQSVEELEASEGIWYIQYTYDSIGRLAKWGSQAITHMEDGRCSTYKGYSITWNGKEMVGCGTHTFTYDAMGRRRTKDSITFTYDAKGKLVKQSNGLSFIYDHNSLIGFMYENNTYFYRRDILGNIIAILDSVGAVVVKYIYDAWGRFSISGNTTIGNINPYKYRGYYFDNETALYFLKTRYYDPDVGRFISMDDVSYSQVYIRPVPVALLVAAVTVGYPVGTPLS